MPINLQDELLRKEQATDAYLKGLKGYETGRQNVARQTLAGSRQPFLKSLGIDQRAIPRITGKLNSEAARTLSRRSLGSNRDRLNVMYQTALKRAEMAGASQQEADAYARQLVMDEMDRSFQAGEQAADIESSRRRELVSDDYANRGIALQNQYMPDVNYEGALYRSLFGLAGAGGTAYALTRKPAQSTLKTNIRGDGASLREQSIFTPRRYA